MNTRILCSVTIFSLFLFSLTNAWWGGLSGPSVQVASSVSVVPVADWTLNPLLDYLHIQYGDNAWFGGFMTPNIYVYINEATPVPLNDTFAAIVVVNVSSANTLAIANVVYLDAGHGMLNGWVSPNPSFPVVITSTVQPNTSVACALPPIFCPTYYTIDFRLLNTATLTLPVNPQLSINIASLGAINSNTGTFTGEVSAVITPQGNLLVFYQYVNADALGSTLGLISVNHALTSYEVLTSAPLPASSVPYFNFLANNAVAVARGDDRHYDIVLGVNWVNLSDCPFGCGLSNVTSYAYDSVENTLVQTGSEALNGYAFYVSLSPDGEWVVVTTGQSSPTFYSSNTYQVLPPYPGSTDPLASVRVYSFDADNRHNTLSYFRGLYLNSYGWASAFSPSGRYLAVTTAAVIDLVLIPSIPPDYYGEPVTGVGAPSLLQVFTFGCDGPLSQAMNSIGELETSSGSFGIAWRDDQTVITTGLPSFAFPETVLATVEPN